jgi:UrcA family protein
MPHLNSKLAALFVPLAGAAFLFSTPASASTDFFFNYHDTELNSYFATKRLYSRLQREALQICAGTGKAGAMRNDCTSNIVSRVVTGIDDKGLTKYHAKHA